MAREFCLDVFRITNYDAFSKDFRLKDQIKASSGSIMDNIAEGFERSGNKEFVQFLYIAKGSCGESRSQLYRALDFLYISKEEFDKSIGNITIIIRFYQIFKTIRAERFKIQIILNLEF